MNTPERFLYLSDAHVKKRTWTNTTLLSDDAYAAQSVLSDKIKNTGITDIVIGGDWFDSSRPSSEDLHRSAEFLSGFRNVYYINGNHDRVRPPLLGAFGKSGHSGNTCYTELGKELISIGSSGKCFITGIPWIHSGSDLLKELEDRCCQFRESGYGNTGVMYVVMHCSFRHLLPFDGSYQITTEDVQRIAAGINVRILVGDIHTRDTVFFGDSGYIHSCGSLYPLSFSPEFRHSYASIIDAVSGRIEDVECTVRNYGETVYESPEALRNFISGIINRSSGLPLQPFVRVLIPDEHADVRLSQSDFPAAVIQAVSKASVQEDAPYAAVDPDSVYSVMKALADEAGDDAELYDLSVRFLTADDPQSEISSWLDERKVERAV